jgi:CHAP domain/Putative peptidoglycan binding domain
MNYPNRVIQTGETNKTIVKAIQQKLNEAGLGPFELTGNYGPKTVNAVKLFQATHRDQNGLPLEIDGKIGSLTWYSLFGSGNIVMVENAASALLTDTLKIAQSQIGVMEDPPGSNRGKKVEAYQASVGIGAGTYWCAAFVYWCFQKACENSNKRNPVLRTGHCMTHWNRTPGKKITGIDAVNKPSLIKPGHIFIINTGGAHGHTGLVEKVEGGFIYTIEGNSNPAGSSNGIGVFTNMRKISKINRGFIEYR